MRFQDLRIPVKLGAAFCAVILASAISSALVFASLKRIDDAMISTQRSLTLAAQAVAAAAGLPRPLYHGEAIVVCKVDAVLVKYRIFLRAIAVAP